MYKKNLLISLLLFLSSSSQLVLADIYKCVSSKGEISYTEKRCDDGAVSKKGRWHSLKKREKILYEKFEEEIRLANINGMSEEDLRLLDATLDVDYEDLSDLGYDYDKWLKIVKLIGLRVSSLKAATDSIANNQEMSREESIYYNLHQSVTLAERVEEDVRGMREVLAVARKYIVEKDALKEAARTKVASRERFALKNKSNPVSQPISIEAITRGEAVQACRAYAKARSLYKNTFDFSIFLDLYTKKRQDGSWLVESSFTVKNKSNLEFKYKVSCVVNNSGGVTEGVID